MSKEAVRRENSHIGVVNRVGAEGAKERAMRERGVSEPATSTHKSFSKLLGEIRQIDARKKRQAEHQETSSDSMRPENAGGVKSENNKPQMNGTQQMSDRLQVDSSQHTKQIDDWRQVRPAGGNRDDSANIAWAKYMDAREAEMRELRRQVAGLQEFVQNVSLAVRAQKEQIAALQREQTAQKEKIAALQREQEVQKDKITTLQKEQTAASEAMDEILQVVMKELVK